MSAIERGGIGLGLLALCLCSPSALAAGPERAWKASAYLQALGLDRPQGLPPSGPLDSNDRGSAGLNHDGLFVQKLEAKVWGPLSEDWGLTVGTQSDLVSSGLNDLFVEWMPASSAWDVKVGQTRLPFGAEEQLSSARLLGAQRALVYGFGNYGHVDAWGLGVLAERGYGVRVDYGSNLASWLSWALQSGAFQAKGNAINPAPAAVGRFAVRLGTRPWALELGASGSASRANLSVPSTRYQALGAVNVPNSAWEQGLGVGGRATVLTWGQDASLDLALLHLKAEAVFQSLGDQTRGGGKLSLACDLPTKFFGRTAYAYASLDQASSNFADGVHGPGTLYRAQTLGIESPLPWNSSLKLERLVVSGDGLAGSFPSGQVFQAQWQIEL